jgi:hypothetical protein
MGRDDKIAFRSGGFFWWSKTAGKTVAHNYLCRTGCRTFWLPDTPRHGQTGPIKVLEPRLNH